MCSTQCEGLHNLLCKDGKELLFIYKQPDTGNKVRIQLVEWKDMCQLGGLTSCYLMEAAGVAREGKIRLILIAALASKFLLEDYVSS